MLLSTISHLLGVMLTRFCSDVNAANGEFVPTDAGRRSWARSVAEIQAARGVGDERALQKRRTATPSWPWRGKPETFTFLGFTHFCGQRISDGAFIVGR